MKNHRFIVFSFIVMIGFATMVQAQATRTWVSGVGDDVNPCSRTAPCKTYAGAISKTAGNGVISTLDPGGFGAVTITKAIMIDGTGQIAGLLASGSNGVNVSALTTDNVVLRGLEIHGANFTGIDGIKINTAKSVHIEDCRIQNFSSRGVAITPATNQVKVVVRNSDIRNNSQGIAVVPTASGSSVLTVSESNISYNTNNGIDMAGLGTNTTAVFNSSIVGNMSGLVVQPTSSTLLCEGCLIAFNQNGVFSGAGGTPVTRLSRCSVFGNTTQGLTGTGTVVGNFNNTIVGNGGNNTVSSSVTQQ